MKQNNSIFTRVLALVLCMLMCAGVLTACFQMPEFNPVLNSNGVPTPDSTTGSVGENTPNEDPVDPEEPVDPNLIFSASTTVDSSNLILGTLTNDVVIGGEGATALVPADVMLETGASTLALTLKNVEENDVDFGDAELLNNLDVHISGIAANNTVPMTVALGAILEAGLGATELKLYHIENGEAVLMTRVASANDFAIHNQYVYNEATGEVTIYVASFSVFTATKSTPSVWDGEAVAEGFASGTGTEEDPFIINSAAQLIYFRNQVDAGNKFEGQFVKLGVDIDLNKKLFNPIGGGWAYNGDNTFNGTFDGGNHTIYNLYVNGWALDETGDKHSGTSKGAGLFSSLHNATIKNLAVVGSELIVETTSIGIIAGVAQGTCTFNNIVVSDATLGNYQMRNGGIVGDIYVIESDNVQREYSHIFENIVVDSSVKLSSMWGDFDTGNGGVIGGKYGSSKVLMKNVIVAAELDVFSDVTAAYQWYAYRRCGMLVGYTGQNSPKQATNAAADFLTCENVNVYYGDWVNYTYYQFTNQTDEQGNRLWNSNYPWVRAQASPYNGPFSNVRYGNPVINGGKINTLELAEANKTGYAEITFNQLYGGGQGVYGTAEHKGVTTNSKEYKTIYVNNNGGWENLKLQYWFANGKDTWTTIIDGIDMKEMLVDEANGTYKIQLPNTAYAFKIVADGEASQEFVLADLENNATVTLNGEVVEDCTHTNTTTTTVDATCTEDGSTTVTCDDCHETISVTEIPATGHVNTTTTTVDATCTTNGSITVTCACGHVVSTETISAKGHTAGAEADCDNAQTCTVCGAELHSALGHTTVVDAAVAPTCTTTGLTEGSHCSACNKVLVAQTVVDKVAHTPAEAVKENEKASTCTVAGSYDSVVYCSVCKTHEISREKVTLELAEHTVVTDKAVPATCTTAGKTEGSHCSACNEVLVAQQTVAALGHTWNQEDPYHCSVCGGDATTTRIYFQNNWLWKEIKVEFTYSNGDVNWTTTIDIASLDNNPAFDGTYDIYELYIPTYLTNVVITGLDNYTGTYVKNSTPTITPKEDYVFYLEWDGAKNTVPSCKYVEGYKTIYFQNNWNWDAPQFKYFGNTISMTKTSTNASFTTYSFNIPNFVESFTVAGNDEESIGISNSNVTNGSTYNMLYKDGKKQLVASVKVKFTPNSYWKTGSNIWYAAYVWIDNNTVAWVKMSASSTTGTYECYVPGGYDNIIFCRMGKLNSTTTYDWSNRWNQTKDLKISTLSNSSYNMPEEIYFKPDSNWKSANARFAAYFFGNGDTWVSMVDREGDGVYECEIPSGYPNVIFVRMNGSASANNWNNKWTQTADLTMPSGKYLFTLNNNSSTDGNTKAQGSWGN